MKSHVMKKVSSLALGSSMLILSMLPAASAFAQSAPTVTLTESGYNNIAAQVQPGQSVTFDASASGISNPMYQFWVEQPDGQWIDAQNYSSSSTFTLSNVQAGDYLVAVDVLSAAQLKAGDYSAAIQPLADGVFVDSSVTLSVPSASVVAGHTLTVSATATNIFDPLYQFWYKAPNGQWYQSGNYSSSNSFTFTPSMSGTYTFIAYAKSPLAVNDPEGALYSNTGSATVLPVVQVGLSDSASTLPNDGKTTDTFTAAVTDPNGNPMSGVAVTFTTSNSGVISFASGAAATATTNASGVATVTGTAGTTVGTALVTAEADMQSSAPVTITTTQSAATQIGAVTGTPSGSTSASTTTNTVTAVTPADNVVTLAAPGSIINATAGTPETLTTTIEDAEGNPVPNQTIVLEGNHVNTNSATTAQDSVLEPNSTTFTPFSSSSFGLETSNASGVVSFTVNNSANVYGGDMTMNLPQPNGETYTVGSVLGGTVIGTPYNTYTFYATSATVTEGQPLPAASGLVQLGSAYVGWAVEHPSATALGIFQAPSTASSASLPQNFTSGDSTVSEQVASGHHADFTVMPYVDNNQPNSNNPEFMWPTSPLGAYVPGSITYTVTAGNLGKVDYVDGVSLSGNGLGWSYDTVTQQWYEGGPAGPGTSGGINYANTAVQVTVSYVEDNGTTVPEVTVAAPGEPSLVLTGPNQTLPGYVQQTPGALSFSTNSAIAGSSTVVVTASSTMLTAPVNSATASVTYESVPTSATVSPMTIDSATSLNNATASFTFAVTNQDGNPVPDASLVLDGAVMGQGYSGYFNSPTQNDALWITAVDGHQLTYGGNADAFPLTNPAAPISGGYQYPSPVTGVFYAEPSAPAPGALHVVTNSAGDITVTVQGGEAAYQILTSSGTLQPEFSQNVTNNQFWVSLWNPGVSNLAYATVGSGATVEAPAPLPTGSITGVTVTPSSSSVTAGTAVTFTGTVTGTTSGVISGDTITYNVDGITGTTTTDSSGNYSFTVAPTAATSAANDVTVTATAATQTGTTTSSSTTTVTVKPGAISQLVVTTSPTSVVAGTASTITVAYEDKYGNVVDSSSVSSPTIVATNSTVLDASPSGKLGTTGTVTQNSNGSYTLAFTAYDAQGGATLQIAGDGYTITQGNISVAPATTSALSVGTMNAATTANGAGVYPNSITINDLVDAYGNLIESASDFKTSGFTVTTSAGSTVSNISYDAATDTLTFDTSAQLTSTNTATITYTPTAHNGQQSASASGLY
ncbi:triple tyrosine motif-containing protein [Sulfobacillus thermosulfidooxidans]|uniref:triple tyrosine motif-containing protein n=1 Tax=Sulfobacillus thermosulfidooxidans TaxID=28034 RepID=UPI00036863A3|nr:triple tyrosine motif-containing protein [Sulfobacillus thermosulfidooxidans]